MGSDKHIGESQQLVAAVFGVDVFAAVVNLWP